MLTIVTILFESRRGVLQRKQTCIHNIHGGASIGDYLASVRGLWRFPVANYCQFGCNENMGGNTVDMRVKVVKDYT